MSPTHEVRSVPAAEAVAAWLAATRVAHVSPAAVEIARRLLVDVAGLCVAARGEDYVKATIASSDGRGACTAIGQAGSFSVFDAALINGTAAHGEDFDDTFEGGPVHSGAVIVPAVLAVCEREQLAGDRALIGLVTGVELMCRMSLVAPTGAHRAGFHPTAVFGAVAAAGGVAAALGLPPAAIASALGIAGSMASGIIEYLAEGTWTKRMHAGWAAQSGIRAALMARAGFRGPRTVLDGSHGFYRAFTPAVPARFEPLLEELGTRWIMEGVAFKPHACGTMAQPFMDCSIALAESGVKADDVREIVCEVAEGTVHRLWEPLASKQRPPTAYAAKFSTPFCMAVAFHDRRAGFAQFTDTRIQDHVVLSLAGKIRYIINPDDEYPRAFTGHLRATMNDGSRREIRQPYLRGGMQAPLSVSDIEAKFRDNVRYGGWPAEAVEAFLAFSQTAFAARSFERLQEFRS